MRNLYYNSSSQESEIVMKKRSKKYIRTMLILDDSKETGFYRQNRALALNSLVMTLFTEPENDKVRQNPRRLQVDRTFHT